MAQVDAHCSGRDDRRLSKLSGRDLRGLRLREGREQLQERFNCPALASRLFLLRETFVFLFLQVQFGLGKSRHTKHTNLNDVKSEALASLQQSRFASQLQARPT